MQLRPYQQDVADQQDIIKQRVEAMAAQIFVDAATARVIGSDDLGPETFDDLITQDANRSIDAALPIGRELYGISAQRNKPPVAPKRRPKVLTEEEETTKPEE